MTGAQPAVSVIVPCYKVTEYVPEALDSLRAQTFRDFETIVVNDGCPDTANLERALEPYRGEIVYLTQENAGLAGARNTGIRAARAPLVAFLDSDDIWEPNYLEVQTALLAAHPEAGVVYPNAIFFGPGASTWSGRAFQEMLPSSGEPTFENILTGKCSVFVGATARRQTLLDAGLFDASLRSAEDLDLWLRLTRSGVKLLRNRQPLARYRLRVGSLSDDRADLARAAIRVYRKMLDAGVSAGERRLLEKAIEAQEVLIDFRLGRKALYAGDREEALRRLTRAAGSLRNYRLRAAILMLRVCPGLLHRLIHRRYPTEHLFLH